MGESKRRKESDPNYGHPLPKPDYRGLVISPPISINLDGSMYIRDSWLDPQELRFSLLFWDRLSWPTGQNQLGTDPNATYLEECGVLERPHYNIGGPIGLSILNGQIAAYQDAENKAPGAWAMAQGDNSLMIKGGIGEIGKGALIELSRAIPIPAASVHLNDILEFKERRRDQLMRFRFHLEALADDVANSPDRSEQLELHLKDINSACADLMALGKEWQCPIHVSTFKTSLNLKPSLVGKVAGAWEFGSKLGLEFATVAAAATGIYHGVKIDTDLGIRSPKRPISPYRYAYHIHTELL